MSFEFLSLRQRAVEGALLTPGGAHGLLQVAAVEGYLGPLDFLLGLAHLLSLVGSARFGLNSSPGTSDYMYGLHPNFLEPEKGAMLMRSQRCQLSLI